MGLRQVVSSVCSSILQLSPHSGLYEVIWYLSLPSLVPALVVGCNLVHEPVTCELVSGDPPDCPLGLACGCVMLLLAPQVVSILPLSLDELLWFNHIPLLHHAVAPPLQLPSFSLCPSLRDSILAFLAVPVDPTKTMMVVLEVRLC